MEESGCDEEEEEEDDENGDDWIDVDDDDDDVKNESLNDTTNQEEISKQQRSKNLNNIRGRLDARRVLSDSDFALLHKLRAAQLTRSLDPKFRGKNSSELTHNASSLIKRKHIGDDDSDDDNENNRCDVEYAVNPNSLEPGTRSEKTSKIDRIMHVLDGRNEKRFEKEKHAGGLTNKEKLRKKNFMMVRKGKREVRGKINKSNSQKRYEKIHKVFFLVTISHTIKY